MIDLIVSATILSHFLENMMVQNMISSYLEQKALPTIPCQIDIEGLAKMKQSLRAQQFQNTLVMYEWAPHFDKKLFGAYFVQPASIDLMMEAWPT